MAITSPDEQPYCLNVGDTIAIGMSFSHYQPNKLWYQVVDGSHCPDSFCQNPYQCAATEVNGNSSGVYDFGVYTVTDNDHHNAHVRFWWILPNDFTIKFDKRNFSIAAPDSDSCSGVSFRRTAAAKAVAKKTKKKMQAK